MCEEISPWKFIINGLYCVKDSEPLSLNPEDKEYFWKYTMLALEKIKTELDEDDVCVYADRYSLENVLFNNNLYITINNKNKLALDGNLNIDSVNKYLNPDLGKKLSDIFKEAYQEL